MNQCNEGGITLALYARLALQSLYLLVCDETRDFQNSIKIVKSDLNHVNPSIHPSSLFQTTKSIENKNKKTIHIYNEKRS